MFPFQTPCFAAEQQIRSPRLRSRREIPCVAPKFEISPWCGRFEGRTRDLAAARQIPAPHERFQNKTRDSALTRAIRAPNGACSARISNSACAREIRARNLAFRARISDLGAKRRLTSSFPLSKPALASLPGEGEVPREGVYSSAADSLVVAECRREEGGVTEIRDSSAALQPRAGERRTDRRSRVGGRALPALLLRVSRP